MFSPTRRHSTGFKIREFLCWGKHPGRFPEEVVEPEGKEISA